MESGERVSVARRLWLVRHGETTWNSKGLVQGQRDPGLSPVGREQIARCCRTLAEASPEAIYSSDLRRALESAAPISRALGVGFRADPDLRERSLGDAEGLPATRLGPERSGVTAGRVVDADAAPTGGESVRQLYERVASCAARILSLHKGDIVLVCHGGVVRALCAWLDGVPPEEMAWTEVENGVPILRRVASAWTCA